MTKGKTLIPDDFSITPEMRAWADKTVPRLDLDYYHGEFTDHWAGNGKLMKDWPATWRNWMRRTDRGAAPGMYGPDDKSIRRKEPRLVQPEQLRLTAQEKEWERIDRLRKDLVNRGVPMTELRDLDLEGLKERDRALRKEDSQRAHQLQDKMKGLLK